MLDSAQQVPEHFREAQGGTGRQAVALPVEGRKAVEATKSEAAGVDQEKVGLGQKRVLVQNHIQKNTPRNTIA
jgi:hypothetical protein